MFFYLAKRKDESLEKIYEVTSINDKVTRPIMGNYIVISACSELTEQNFVVCISAVTYVVQYVKH